MDPFVFASKWCSEAIEFIPRSLLQIRDKAPSSLASEPTCPAEISSRIVLINSLASGAGATRTRALQSTV